MIYFSRLATFFEFLQGCFQERTHPAFASSESQAQSRVRRMDSFFWVVVVIFFVSFFVS
jgi:hypothetical protein